MVVTVFEGLGWEVARRRGSHIVLVRDGSLASLSVPDHHQVARETLRSLIRAAVRKSCTELPGRSHRASPRRIYQGIHPRQPSRIRFHINLELRQGPGR